MNEGDIVLREGEKGDFFYVLAQGAAEVVIQGGDLKIPILIGDFFGEEALIADVPRNATIRMTQDGKVMRLKKEYFSRLLKEPILKYLELSSLQRINANEKYLLLDVRLAPERLGGFVAGTKNVSLSKLRNRLTEFSAEKEYIVTDDGGRRAEIAVHILSQAGLTASILKNSNNFYE